MLSSMTAFARCTQDNEWGTLSWELRTVNHRYLEISLRLPEAFRNQEAAIREKIQKNLKRGKVEATLKYQPGENVAYDFAVNQGLANKLADAANGLKPLFPDSQINLAHILNWQGMLVVKDNAAEQIVPAAHTVLDEALVMLVDSRKREGSALKHFFMERIADMEKNMQIVQQRLPQAFTAERERIMKRFEELSIALDQDRLEQEMVWLMQKADIAEELGRLQAHLAEVCRVLDDGGVIGRRLDFFMQELNREANTIASKSIDTQVSQAAIEMKVLIEQMREQVQNIE